MDPYRFPQALIDTLGIEDFAARKEYGRERGLSPTPTEAQSRAVDKLNQKLQVKVKTPKNKGADVEEEIQFDLKSKKRVILFEGKVIKKNHNSLVQLTTKRYAILLNDVFLLTSDQSTGGLLSTEKLMLHQAIPLEEIAIRDLKNISNVGDDCAFDIIHNGVATTLSAESESDKQIWLEEIEAAIFCIRAAQPHKNIGWQHEAIRHTLYSAAMYEDVDSLQLLLQLEDTVIDQPDESGMTALHWASMFGQYKSVQMLIQSGCDVDCMNSGLNSPLLLASAMGHAQTTFLLIDNGADVLLRNLGDMDSMFMSCMYGATNTDLYDIIQVLQRKGIDINQQDSSGATPLHRCASSSVSRPIQALVDCGADVNLKHGRSGLTPLQLASCGENSDPETVRSLLDKGAHPNWRDASLRSSFDLVLAKHRAKIGGRVDATTSAGADPRMSMKDTLDEVQEFVQESLPVLMELVRKGARFTPESIASLRPSFQEVINTGRKHWDVQVQPDDFAEFVNSIPEALTSKHSWVDDGASQHCLLCVQKFTYSSRRHHCRTCGILCCDLCSSKRLRLTKTAKPSRNNMGGATRSNSGGSSGISSSSSGSNSPPPPPQTAGDSSRSITPPPKPNAKDMERVCDGCFNKMTHESFLWQQAMAKARKYQEKLAAERPELLQDTSLSTAEAPITAQDRKAGGGGVSRAKNAATETRRALEQRGEKLQQVAERSEQIVEAASDFKKMTSQLLKQQQSQTKSGWL
mmetsp:Transcript_1547/g.2560  ORF Transcript_1547/g.2560 Transcript_1547/m.2560 type:complete len:746 (+) Transcript_1547:107-2344(+)